MDCNYQIQSVSHIHMAASPHLSNPAFLTKALKLGYTKQDLTPITIQQIVRNSASTLRDMTQAQRQYYIDKKYKALLERQNKIIAAVVEDGRGAGTRERKGFNPVIKKLLDDHQQRLEKRARYEERVRVSKTRDMEHRKISNTIDFGRTSPNFTSSSANGSRVSKRSMRSQDSRTSQRSNSSHKERLMLVRLKQKEEEKYKKNLLRHNQDQSKKKIDRVHQSRLSESRRLKTKSQISQQAVQQRKQQLRSLQTNEMRDHLEKLKYKMLKNEYIKQRQQQKRLNVSTPHDSLYKRQLKNMFEQSEKQQNRARYEEKIRSVERKKWELEQIRRMDFERKAKEKAMKEQQVLKYREHMVMENEHRKRQTLYYEAKNLERARNQKLQLQSEKKMKLIESRVKEEIVKSNFNSIENRRRLQSQRKARQINEKLQEIKDIQSIKRKLTRERNRNNFNRKEDQDYKFSFY